MKWTTKTPTEPGLYWARVAHERGSVPTVVIEPRAVLVTMDWFGFVGSNATDVLPEHFMRSDLQWSDRPIPEPEEAP